MKKFKLLTGDTLRLLKQIPDSSVDAVITDPPFSTGTRKEGQKGIRKSMNRQVEDSDWFDTDSLTTSGFIYLLRECAIEWRRILKPGSHILCFIDWRMYPHACAAIESADLRINNLIVWDKTHFGMGHFFRNQHELIIHFSKGSGTRYNMGTPNVIQCKAIRGGDHPTEKPVELINRLLPVISKPGDTILDCFAGSHSTGVASVVSGRKYIGIDNNKRWETFGNVKLSSL